MEHFVILLMSVGTLSGTVLKLNDRTLRKYFISGD